MCVTIKLGIDKVSEWLCFVMFKLASKILRCVHTMPHGRMQHTAALPHGKSCSAYAANAIASTWKTNFLQTFRLRKLWNEIGELGLIFFSIWLIPFWNLLFIICHVASFDGTNNFPIKFLGCAASNDMSQPSRCNIHIYLWHGATFAIRPYHTLSLCAVRHSVDVPLELSRASIPFVKIFWW